MDTKTIFDPEYMSSLHTEIGTSRESIHNALQDLKKLHLHFVVALQSGEAGRLYGRGTKRVREARKGIVLQPEPGDAQLLGSKTPKASLPYPPGRGYVIENGVTVLVHTAGPLEEDEGG